MVDSSEQYDWSEDDPDSWMPRLRELRTKVQSSPAGEETLSQQEKEELRQLQRLQKVQISKDNRVDEGKRLTAKANSGEQLTEEEQESLNRYTKNRLIQKGTLSQFTEVTNEYIEAAFDDFDDNNSTQENSTSPPDTRPISEIVQEPLAKSGGKGQFFDLPPQQDTEHSNEGGIPLTDNISEPVSDSIGKNIGDNQLLSETANFNLDDLFESTLSTSSPENNSGEGVPSESGGDNSSGGPPSTESKSPDGNGFALERTTQERLIEIRDAIKALGGDTGPSNGVPPPKEKEQKQTDYEKDTEAYEEEQQRRRERRESQQEADERRKDASGMGGSSKNLGDFVQRTISVGRRFRERRERQQPQSKRPNKRDYDNAGMRLQKETGGTSGSTGGSLLSFLGGIFGSKKKKGGGIGIPGGASSAESVSGLEGAVIGAEEGAVAGPEGAVVGGIAGAVGGGGGEGSSPLGAITDVASKINPAGLVVDFAQAVMEFSKATYQFARAQEAEVRRLSEVGGQQAAGVAILDAQRLLRDVKTAEETGTSSNELTQSISAFEEALRPIESLITNISNSVAGGILDILTQVVYIIQPMADVVKAIYDVLPWRKGPAPGEKLDTPLDFIKRLEEDAVRRGEPKWPGSPLSRQRQS